jgi:hypothetical protein
MLSPDENARARDQLARADETPLDPKHFEERFNAHHAATRASGTPSILMPYVSGNHALVPLGKRSKMPLDRHWTTRAYRVADVVRDFERGAINLGVRLTADVAVLDVDPRNFGDGDSLLALMIDTGLDLRTVPHTVTGSGGSHYWFSKPAEARLRDHLPAYPGIEFKSLGRQVVTAGSTHPCGGLYRWDGEPPSLVDLPPLPQTVLDVYARQAPKGATGGFGELTPAQLEALLEQLDPADFSDHDGWFNLMAGCHHASGGDACQQFVDWSTQDPRYAGDGDVIAYRWGTLDEKGACSGGRPITARYLYKVAKEHGAVIPHPDPADDFDTVDVPDGYGVDDAMLRQEPKLAGIEAVIEEMNSRHYVVLDNGFQVVTEEPDPVLDGRVRYQRLSKTDFRSSYENRLVEHNDRVVSYADVWLKSPRRRQYKGMIFDPEREHDGWLNLWKGWAVEPAPGDWSLLRQLILEVLVDGDEAHFEWVLDWIAYMFQHPGRVAEVAVAFRGAKGTGKGTLGRALARLAGAQGLHISSPGHLTGRFNSHLQNCICLFADEAFWAGDKAGESVLKQLVTEPTLTYEGKGRDAVSGRNHVHIVMASNADWVVPAGLDGERRFAVFEVNERRRNDRDFFRRLNRQLEDGGLAALLHDMLSRDLGDRHPRDSVPQTRALADQKVLSMSPEQAWWDSVLEGGELPRPFAEPGEWERGEVRVDLRDLHAHYLDHVRRHGGRGKSEQALAMAIKGKAGVRRVQVARKWYWALPQLDDARAIWAKAVGRSDG